MKIPLIYPKIPGPANCPLKQCVVFEKLDGTNMHWKFTPGIGWTHFGTRRTQFSLDDNGIVEFGKTHPEISEAPHLFLRSMIGIVNAPICLNEIILYTEFLGNNSFAGSHLSSDRKKLVLFDALINGRILDPKSFIDAFSSYNPPDEFDDDFDLPKIVYQGKFSGQLVEDIRNGKYKVNEGVIIKGPYKGEVYMCKVKTNEYLNRLKKSFDDWENYWE